MTNPEHPAERPKLVVWAHRCWATGGALLVVFGIVFLVLGAFSTVSRLGPVAIGVLVALVGVAYILMGSKAFAGDERWRSSLAALTLVVVAMLLVVSFLANLLAFALVAGIIALFGSLLAYRPESEAWFTGKPIPEPKPKRNSVKRANPKPRRRPRGENA